MISKPPKPLKDSDSHRFLQFATELADRARRLLKESDPGERKVSLKTDGSYVSEADQCIEAAWREAIAREFPSHAIIGEEFPDDGVGSPWQWILDPIDGTDNFIHGLPTFGTLIALHHEGVPVLGLIDHPALGLRLHAAQGLGAWANGKALVVSNPKESAPPIVMVTAPENFAKGEGMTVFHRLAERFPNLRIYRDCFAHSSVLQGHAAVMVDWHMRLWDVAAAEAIAREAGVAYVRLASEPDRHRAVFGRASWVAAVTALITETEEAR